jgi:DNA-directed RNA polymerase specialized sigma24 family protein
MREGDAPACSPRARGAARQPSAGQGTFPWQFSRGRSRSGRLATLVSDAAAGGACQVLAALQALPPRQRQVMAWIIDGFGAAEIARELGVSPESVRQSYAKARKNLGRFYGRRKKR